MPRKPTIRGRNSLRNVPKAFRSSGHDLNRLICCRKSTALKKGDALVAGKGVNRSIHSDGKCTFNEKDIENG